MAKICTSEPLSTCFMLLNCLLKKKNSKRLVWEDSKCLHLFFYGITTKAEDKI